MTKATVPSRPSGGPRQRVLLYSHCAVGLGHVRLLLAVAGELSRRRPDATLLALAGSRQIHAFELPPNLDAVTLPPVANQARYADLRSSVRRTKWSGVRGLRTAICERVAAAFAPHLVLVENMPAGHDGELLPTLRMLRAARPRPTLVFAMHDILGEPEAVVPYLRAQRAYELLEGTFDRILIYGDRAVFDPVAAYRFPAAAAAKTVYCGYLAPPAPTTSADDLRARLGTGDAPLVIVSAGGGAYGAALMRTYLAALREPALTGVASFVVTGPLLADAVHAELAQTSASMPDVTIARFVSDFHDYLHAADAVVSMGGYSSSISAIAAGTCPVIVPQTTLPEQRLRAEAFARLGLASLLPPDELTPTRLALAVRAALDRTTSPPPVLDFEGLRRAGDALEQMLGPRRRS